MPSPVVEPSATPDSSPVVVDPSPTPAECVPPATSGEPRQVTECHTQSIDEQPRVQNLHPDSAAGYCDYFYHTALISKEVDTRHDQDFNELRDGQWTLHHYTQQQEVTRIRCGDVQVCQEVDVAQDPNPGCGPATPPEGPACVDKYVEEKPRLGTLHENSAEAYCQYFYQAPKVSVERRTRYDDMFSIFQNNQWVKHHYAQEREVLKIKCGPIRVCTSAE
jgi:hypothetical protein